MKQFVYDGILTAAMEANVRHNSPETRRVVAEAQDLVVRVKSAAEELLYGGLTRDTKRERAYLGMPTPPKEAVIAVLFRQTGETAGEGGSTEDLNG